MVSPESDGTAIAETPEPDSDQSADLGPSIEELKRQLRAVTQERSAERQRANALQEQLATAQAYDPSQPPAIPGIPTHTAPPEGTSLSVISPLADPELAGLLFDQSDDTVCIGDPDKISDWVSPEVARKVVQANRLAAREEALQHQTAVHETYKAFEQFSQAMQEHGKKLRAQVLPHITDETATEAVDRQIAALTMQRMRDAGITVEGIAFGDPSIRDKAADFLAESVEDIRKVHVMLARDAGKANDRARATAPVRGGGGSGITGAKPVAEMTRGERRNYFQKVAENRLS
jgi:hypothetical protein